MFYVTTCGICCVLIIFERQQSRLGSKISGYGQLAVVAVDGSTPRSGHFQAGHAIPEGDLRLAELLPWNWQSARTKMRLQAA